MRASTRLRLGTRLLITVGLIAGGSAAQAESVRQLCRFPDGERRVVYQSLGSRFQLAVDNCEDLPPGPGEAEERVEVMVNTAPAPMFATAAPREIVDIRVAVRDVAVSPLVSTPANVLRAAWAPAPTRASLLSPASSAPGAPVPPEYQRLIARSAFTHGVDPRIVEAVMYVESRFRADARSPKGALGLMQLMPQTALSGCGVPTARLFDPATNIECGARYLGELTATFAGRLDLALAAYNAGPGAVMKHGGRVPPFAETRDYVDRVLQRLRSSR